MNLSKLFEMQRKLDERIIEEKGLQGQNLLDKKILALQVELGELCNCWRGFKYWSNDQEPRTVKYIENRKHRQNPLLEEYVDCLHFILSIGLEIGFTEEPTGIIREYDVIHQFNKMFYMVGDFYDFYIRYGKGCGLYDTFDDLFGYFLGLGEILGFTWEQIEQAYIQKNAENHCRQAEGY